MNTRSWTFNLGFMLLAGVSALTTIVGTALLAMAALGASGDPSTSDATGTFMFMLVGWFLWGAFWTALWFLFGAHRTNTAQR